MIKLVNIIFQTCIVNWCTWKSIDFEKPDKSESEQGFYNLWNIKPTNDDMIPISAIKTNDVSANLLAQFNAPNGYSFEMNG